MRGNVMNQPLDRGNQANNGFDKNKLVRDERKHTLAMTAEMSLGSKNHGNYPGMNRNPTAGQFFDYSSSNQGNKIQSGKFGNSLLDRAPSVEELSQARTSLRLLKAKIRDTNTNFGNYDSQNDVDPDIIHAPGKKNLGVDYNTNDLYNQNNNNYRRVFKPNLKPEQGYRDEDYDKMNKNINQELNNLDKNLSKKAVFLKGTNQRGQPDEENVTISNANSRLNLKKPPLGNSGKAETLNTYDFSENRVPQNMKQISSSKAESTNFSKPNNYPSSNQNKFGKQQDYEHELKMPAKSNPNNSIQNSKPPSNKSGKVLEEKYDRDENEYQNKIYSKPALKKPTGKSNDPNDIPIQSKPLDVPEYADIDELVECQHGCGRKFNPDSIEKHEKICVTVFQKKRTKFDTAAQRKTDELLELESDNPRKFKGKNSKPQAQTKSQLSKAEANAKWKQQSEAFRAGLRAARGQKLSADEQSALDNAGKEDLVPCPHCGRKFNENAANKHIPFCETKSKVDKVKSNYGRKK